MTENQTSTNNQRPMWQRLSFLVGLIVVLVLTNMFYPVAQNWRSTLTGEPGTLLYAAGFDNFTDEWEQYEGRNSARIIDGILQIEAGTSATIYSAVAPNFRDFDATVTLRAVGGSEENEGAGIVFRLQRPGEGCKRSFLLACGLADMPFIGTPVKLLFPLEDNAATGFYVFLISTDGYYSIWRSNAQNQLEKATVWHNSDGLINTGLDVDNTIRVVGRGDEFSFFINGEQVDLCVPLADEQPTGNAANCMGEWHSEWVDETFAEGQLGLVVNTNQFPGTIIAFDNFTVLSPEALPGGDQL